MFRPDFRAHHADGTATLLETKQVVDTDYDPATANDAAAAQPGPVTSDDLQAALQNTKPTVAAREKYAAWSEEFGSS